MWESWEDEEEGWEQRRCEVLITTGMGRVPIGSKTVLGGAGHGGSRKLGRPLWWFHATSTLFIVGMFEGHVIETRSNW